MTTGIKDTNFIDRSEQDSMQRNAGLQLQLSTPQPAFRTTLGMERNWGSGSKAQVSMGVMLEIKGAGGRIGNLISLAVLDS